MDPKKYVSEVIESSTTRFVSEFRKELEGRIQPPPFGSLLKVEGAQTVFGITCNVSVRSVEPNRRPAAFGMTHDTLRKEHPEVFKLLRTEIDALVVGWSDPSDGQCYQMLPHESPQIHSFVHQCDSGEVEAFCRELDFLRIILNANLTVPAEELVVSGVRHALKSVSNAERCADLKVRVGKELAKLVKNDYELLSSLVKRISM